MFKGLAKGIQHWCFYLKTESTLFNTSFLYDIQRSGQRNSILVFLSENKETLNRHCSTQVSCTIFKELAKGIQHWCFYLKTKKRWIDTVQHKFLVRYSRKWPKEFNIGISIWKQRNVESALFNTSFLYDIQRSGQRNSTLVFLSENKETLNRHCSTQVSCTIFKEVAKGIQHWCFYLKTKKRWIDTVQHKFLVRYSRKSPKEFNIGISIWKQRNVESTLFNTSFLYDIQRSGQRNSTLVFLSENKETVNRHCSTLLNTSLFGVQRNDRGNSTLLLLSENKEK